MKQISTLILILAFTLNSSAQINGYAKISLILGPAITVTNVDETYGTFTTGQKVIVMQMQDNVIGSNTSNNSSFGNLSTIANAGRYEVATIGLVARVLGLVNVITLTAPLNNTFNLGANSSVQIITFPTLGSPDFTTTADIVALPWNGNVGGVVAFNVNGKLNLHHNILAEGAGFRGGVADASSSPYGSCNATSYFNAVDPFYGNKGEGIYKSTNSNFTSGRGKMINAGGGGNTINSGGGGGANFTGGGLGSIGWSCVSAETGGVGGVPLDSYISAGRLFMGGGGGSGEANDNNNNKGGNGGGLIIITASEIKTTGTGSNVRISSNGQAANNVSNDGAGGGGAGGSIAFQVGVWNIAAGRKLDITSSGAKGGNVGTGDRHGGGGGGGQGVAAFSTALPTSNITVNTASGIGGENWVGGTRGQAGLGTINSGILASSFNILPLKLLSFTAVKKNEKNELEWKTTDEVNVNRFEIQRSADGTSFETIGSKASVGSKSDEQSYTFTDLSSTSTRYYRLRMVDNDGKYTYSNIAIIRSEVRATADINVFPNPANSSSALLVKSGQSGTATIRIMNMMGAVLATQNNMVNRGENAFVLESVSKLTNGVYNIQVTINDTQYYTRLIVQK